MDSSGIAKPTCAEQLPWGLLHLKIAFINPALSRSSQPSWLDRLHYPGRDKSRSSLFSTAGSLEDFLCAAPSKASWSNWCSSAHSGIRSPAPTELSSAAPADVQFARPELCPTTAAAVSSATTAESAYAKHAATRPTGGLLGLPCALVQMLLWQVRRVKNSTYRLCLYLEFSKLELFNSVADSCRSLKYCLQCNVGHHTTLEQAVKSILASLSSSHRGAEAFACGHTSLCHEGRLSAIWLDSETRALSSMSLPSASVLLTRVPPYVSEGS